MALAPALRAQGPEGRLPHAQSAGVPGRPSQGPSRKGGSEFMPGGASPEPTAYVTPAPGTTSSMISAAASGESGGGTENRQDGDLCDQFSNVAVFGPTTTFPAGMPPAANYSLIGAAPHDLGALIRGGASVPAPGFDDGASLQAQAILSSPMAHPSGYGAAFAVGSHGTVSPSTGAFVHPFTLLALPSYAQRMGLLLQLEYLSNAEHPSADALPFGSGFVLSGLDHIVEIAGGAADAGATSVGCYRGDGHLALYVRPPGGTSPWTYSGPTGAQDVLTAQYNAGTQTLTYTRTLRDGRAITYERVGTFGQVGGDRYVRSRVVDGYGNQIQYGWLMASGLAYLQTITDTRGMVVQCLWDQGSPARLATLFVDPTGAQIDPAQPGGGAITAADLQIDFTYDTLRRLQKIEWFPTNVTYDANADGRVAVAESAVLRPTVALEYEGNGKLAKVWDTTIATAPVLHLHMEYAVSQDWGVRVVTQAEGGTVGTSGVITHTYGYPSATSRTYVDPRGRTATLGLDTSEYRVATVKMEPGPLTPRTTDDQLQMEYADHTKLNWVIQYACCGLPSAIVEPTGRAFAFAWDGNALQQLWVGGQSVHAFEQDAAGRVVKWWPGAVVPADPALAIAYTDISGKVAPTSVVVTSRLYYDPRTNTSVGASVATLTFEPTTGRLTGTTHSGTGTTMFTYAAGGTTKGRLLLQSIEGPAAGADLKVTYACDDLGRPSSLKRGLVGGERETLLVVDSLHRVRRTLAKAVSAGSEIASEAYHDRLGSVSLARRENRRPDGTFRTRPWLQGEVIRDALGRTVKTVRDAAAVEAPQEQPLATTTTWYGDHRMHTSTPPNGGVTTYVWDGYGLLYKTLVVASGATTLTPTRVFYNKDGQVWATWNGLAQELKVDRFSATGLVSSVYDPAGLNRLDLGYDPSLRLSRVAVWSTLQAAEVRVTVLTYDELERVERISTGSPAVADSHRIHVYDMGGRLVEVGLQEDRLDSDFTRGFKRAFDSYGRLVWQRDRLADETQPTLCNRVEFTYHGTSGLPTKVTEHEIEQAANEFGDLSIAGAHTTHVYDTLLTHDLLDRVTQVEQKPEGGTGTPVVHTYHYDSLGDLVRFQDTLGAELRWAFDGLGNVVARTEKGTAGTEITTTTAIDFVTGVVERMDAEQRVSRFRHDKAWRLEKQELPGYTSGPAFSHEFSYDAASRLIEIVNGNGVHILRSYDASGRMLEQWAVPPLNGHSEWATKEVFAYDELGGLFGVTTKAGTTYATQVVNVTQRQDEYGRTLSEEFDFGIGGLRGVYSGYSYFDGSMTREDLLIRRQLTVDGVGPVKFQLDRLGRTWGYDAGGGATEAFIAKYRFVGGRVRERRQGQDATTPDSWRLATDYGWDPLRRLTSIETKTLATPGAVLSRFDHEFDEEGHLVKRKHDRVGVGAGGGDWFKLDEYYRLANTKLGVDPSQFGAAHSNAAFDAITSYQREVEYSPASAPLDKAQNRHLVKETVGGNTTSTVYAVDANSHRYDSVGGMLLTYDGEGNLLSDGLRLFVYDFKNRLSEVWMYAPAEGEPEALSASASRDGRARYAVPIERLHRIRARARTTLLSADRMRRGYADVTGRAALANSSESLAAVEGNLQLVALYGYDPFNRRVVRHVVGQLGLYSTWDGWREVAEQVWLGSSWFAVRSYVWGGRIDELVRYSRNYGAGWEHFHPQQDHQDSVELLVGADGAPKEKYEYDAFGGVTVFTWSGTAWGNPLPASSLGNPYTYTGRRLDDETGLMYYRNRYYWPMVGRFVTGDPTGPWGDVLGRGNMYVYGGNSPVWAYDPLGLYTLAVLIRHAGQGPAAQQREENDARAVAQADPEGGRLVIIDVDESGNATVASSVEVAPVGADGQPVAPSETTSVDVSVAAHGIPPPTEGGPRRPIGGLDDGTGCNPGGTKTTKLVGDVIQNTVDERAPSGAAGPHGGTSINETLPPTSISVFQCYGGHTDWLQPGKRSGSLAPGLADRFGVDVTAVPGLTVGSQSQLKEFNDTTTVSPKK